MFFSIVEPQRLRPRNAVFTAERIEHAWIAPPANQQVKASISG
ncbi:MAG TPA: hypothetical protein VGI11_04520 [Variovorax sp.]